LEKGQVGKIYNIGCDEGMEYSILEVAKILIKRIKGVSEDGCEQWIKDRPINDQRYYISNQKLKDLGWTIKIDFLSGIEALC
jgi:dTDP-D-glucose 4,6-dehydratase